MDPAELKLDGNAIAGMLLDIFGREMTEEVTTCTTCRAEHPLGRLHVYSHGMGTVVRCASCGSVQMKVTSIRGTYLVDLRGVRLLQLRPTL